MTEAIVAVALPLPIQSALSYRASAPLPHGVRVLVPFGERRVIGVVAGPGEEVEGVELRDVLEVLDEAPLVEPQALELAAWVAEHYLAPPGECYRMVLPPAGVAASRAIAHLVGAAPEGDAVAAALAGGPLRVSTLARRVDGDPSARLARLRRQGIVAIEQQLDRGPGFREVRVVQRLEGAVARGRAQAEVLSRLEAAGGRLRLSELIAARPGLRGAVERLATAGGVRVEEERELRAWVKQGRFAQQPVALAGAADRTSGGTAWVSSC